MHACLFLLTCLDMDSEAGEEYFISLFHFRILKGHWGSRVGV